MVSQSDHKLSYVLQFLIVALTVLLINQISSKYRVWWDLTEEKRYTISESSKETLDDLEETLTIEVYLTGELPSNFKRFQNAIEDLLERFAYYGGSNIQYRFVDPNQAGSARSRNEFYRSLVEKGLQQTNLTYTKDGQKSEKVVFPGAVLSYQEKEVGIQLLKGNRAGAIEEMLNQSIEGLEYELISGIHSIIDDSRKRIGFVMGHNEPDTSQLAGFTNVVLSKYDLYRIDLPNRSTPLLGYDAIIVGKPSTAFSTREKYLLDQYVTSGGSLMLMIDVMSVDLKDAEGEGTVPKSNDLKLEDLLFNWGVRINQDYVVDLSCGDYPVVAGMVGNQPRIQLLPWPYFPVITNYGDHPMVRHLDAMRLRFTSTIDTVKAPGVRKTPLFLTSNYTKVMTPPFQVSFDDLREELRPEFFTSGVKSTAYLLEGQFRSLFRNRPKPPGLADFRDSEERSEARVVVIADGDLIRNDFNLRTDEPLPLGVDPYSQTTYANEDFLLKSLDYLTDENGLILSRNKQIKIRPLDKIKVKEEKLFWQVLNVALPIVLILLFGLLKYWLRKRKYG